jgi:hypothetical protein
MILYHLDDAGEYIGESEALLDPLESTEKNPVYLIPRNSTSNTPPEAEVGFARVYDGSTWRQVIDKRGTIFWSSYSESHEIIHLGVDVPEGALLERPEPPAPPAPPADPEIVSPRPVEPIEPLTIEQLGQLLQRTQEQLAAIQSHIDSISNQ